MGGLKCKYIDSVNSGIDKFFEFFEKSLDMGFKQLKTYHEYQKTA